MENNQACTVMYNLKDSQWFKLNNDIRNDSYFGTMQKIGEKLIFFDIDNEDGEINDNSKGDIWEFKDVVTGWRKLNFRLPDNETRNTIKIVAL